MLGLNAERKAWSGECSPPACKPDTQYTQQSHNVICFGITQRLTHSFANTTHLKQILRTHVPPSCTFSVFCFSNVVTSILSRCGTVGSTSMKPNTRIFNQPRSLLFYMQITNNKKERHQPQCPFDVTVSAATVDIASTNGRPAETIYMFATLLFVVFCHVTYDS